MNTIPFSIMTYNVHSCIGIDGRVSVNRIAEVIEPCDCDIVALQEVDMELERTGSQYQAHEIARILAMHYYFQPLLWVKEGKYGIAILSRHPMSILRAAELPTIEERPRIEKRGAIWARIDLGEIEVQVLATHLGLNRRERSLQIDALLGQRWLASAAFSRPLIICGDLNSSTASHVYSRIYKRFQDPFRRFGSATWPSVCPLFRLDYIFVTKDIRVRRIFVNKTPLTRVASDHLPVVAELELKIP